MSYKLRSYETVAECWESAPKVKKVWGSAQEGEEITKRKCVKSSEKVLKIKKSMRKCCKSWGN